MVPRASRRSEVAREVMESWGPEANRERTQAEPFL